jgi:hypothetical protein
MIGTDRRTIHIQPVVGDPTIPGVDPNVLASFGITMQSPVGQSTPSISAQQARTVALPLGDGPQSRGWKIIWGPTLALVNHRVGAAQTTTCLCWVVQLQAPQAMPCEAPIGQPDPCKDYNIRNLIEFVGATNGNRWLSVAGKGLG